MLFFFFFKGWDGVKALAIMIPCLRIPGSQFGAWGGRFGISLMSRSKFEFDSPTTYPLNVRVLSVLAEQIS